jgi:prolyl oligopeptidase
MQYLIDEGYTNPKKLAIRGGSNGGLLMGAMIAQHPDLFAATVSTVGIYDMVRVELSPNGMFNIPEFGTVKNPEHFNALYAYSPYHRVQDGTTYPAILFMTGANDPRVDPMQSRKMTARLQKDTSSNNPVLLRTSSRTGHGGGTPLKDKIEEYTDQYTFLFHFLGVKYEEIPLVNNK